MTQESGRTKLRNPMNLAARVIAIAIMALTAAFLFPSAQAKDKDRPYDPADYTRVYAFTYDEVFQAAQQSMLRRGINVIEADKDKGIIRTVRNVVVVHFEQISPKPEVRVTIDVHIDRKNNPHASAYATATGFFDALQKVLATYQ